LLRVGAGVDILLDRTLEVVVVVQVVSALEPHFQ
jgi:hypothetical protein